MKTNEYTKQAEEFLKKAEATIKIELSKNQHSPLWATKGEDHGLMYDITIKRTNHKNMEFKFWDSIGDKDKIQLLKKEKAPIPNQFGKLVYEYEFGYFSVRKNYQKRIDNGEFNPKEYDILATLTKNNPGDFENFCSEYGYSEDSRKALDTYLEVIKEWNQVEGMFGDLIEELAEIN